ncbi:hypothetical protein FRC10_004203 [Ceratobasidium sp. 414]|nr:hypothetical protein FRC10_004203 [Ceratobasidium sp. 414]
MYCRTWFMVEGYLNFSLLASVHGKPTPSAFHGYFNHSTICSSSDAHARKRIMGQLAADASYIGCCVCIIPDHYIWAANRWDVSNCCYGPIVCHIRNYSHTSMAILYLYWLAYPASVGSDIISGWYAPSVSGHILVLSPNIVGFQYFIVIMRMFGPILRYMLFGLKPQCPLRLSQNMSQWVTSSCSTESGY